MTEKNYELTPLEDEHSGEWESFVGDHAHATPFHTQSWKHAIESTFRYAPRFRVLRDSENGDVAGVIPSFETQGILGNDLTQPFGEYGYPLLNPGVNASSVLRSLSKEVGRFGARIVKDAPWSGITGYEDAIYGGVRTGCTFRLYLDGTYDRLRETTFDGEVRRSVRNARESDVEIRVADIAEYYPVYVQTMRRLGSPQFPQSFFEALTATFGEYCTVLTAELDGTVIAGLLTLSTADNTIIWSSASHSDYWDYKPNHLLYATAIRRAVERNQSVVDFGRTDPESGVHHFKAQFGGTEYPLVSMVAPPHRTSRASLSQYRRLEPLVQRLSRIITHSQVGPRIKEWIHE